MFSTCNCSVLMQNVIHGHKSHNEPNRLKLIIFSVNFPFGNLRIWFSDPTCHNSFRWKFCLEGPFSWGRSNIRALKIFFSLRRKLSNCKLDNFRCQFWYKIECENNFSMHFRHGFANCSIFLGKISLFSCFILVKIEEWFQMMFFKSNSLPTLFFVATEFTAGLCYLSSAGLKFKFGPFQEQVKVTKNHRVNK